jgi:hypothetical protein
LKKLFNEKGLDNICLGQTFEGIKTAFVPFEQTNLKDTFHVSSIRSSWYVYSGDPKKYNYNKSFSVKYIFVCVSDDNTIIRIKVYLEDPSDTVYLYCESLLGEPSTTGKGSVEGIQWSVHHIWNLFNKTITLHYTQSFICEQDQEIEMTYSFLKDVKDFGRFVVRRRFR